MKARDIDREFAEFYRSEKGWLARAAYLLVGDAQAAADLLQDALVRTYANWPRLDPVTAGAYTRKIMTNLSIDRWRRRRYEPIIGDESDRHVLDSAEAGFRGVEQRDDIARQLARLTPRERAIVALRYYDDLSEQDVAARMGIAVGTVKSTCSRALAQLRSSAEGLREGVGA